MIASPQSTGQRDQTTNPGFKGEFVKGRSNAENTVSLTASLMETREREAALREVLRIISRSREDETPVFELLLKHAAKLCNAPIASMHIADWEWNRLNWVAHHGENLLHYRPGHTSLELESESIPARSVFENRRFHIKDLADTDLYR